MTGLIWSSFAIFFLVMRALFFILVEKWNLHIWLYNKTKLKLIDGMTDCEFCMQFWIGMFIMPFLFIISVNFIYLLFPLMAAELNRIIERNEVNNQER